MHKHTPKKKKDTYISGWQQEYCKPVDSTFVDQNFPPPNLRPKEICSHNWTQHLDAESVLQTTWKDRESIPKREKEKKHKNRISTILGATY